MLIAHRSWIDVPRKHSYMVPSPPNSFGARLRQLRMERDLTQTQLIELLGLKQSSVSKWERGEVKQPSPESIAALERFFGVPSGSLLALAEADQRNYRPEPPPPGSLVVANPTRTLRDTVEVLTALSDSELRRIQRMAATLLATPSRFAEDEDHAKPA